MPARWALSCGSAMGLGSGPGGGRSFGSRGGKARYSSQSSTSRPAAHIEIRRRSSGAKATPRRGCTPRTQREKRARRIHGSGSVAERRAKRSTRADETAGSNSRGTTVRTGAVAAAMASNEGRGSEVGGPCGVSVGAGKAWGASWFCNGAVRGGGGCAMDTGKRHGTVSAVTPALPCRLRTVAHRGRGRRASWEGSRRRGARG